MYAAHDPSSNMKNLSPGSPCLMISSSASNRTLSIISESLDSSYWFSDLSRSTSESHPSYISYCVCVFWTSIILKGSCSNFHNLQVSEAMQTVAARGAEYIKASSPNSAPGPSVIALAPRSPGATWPSGPLRATNTSTWPSPKMYRQSPSSPCLMMSMPCGKVTSWKALMTSSTPLASKWPNKTCRLAFWSMNPFKMAHVSLSFA
mmetsp:Transcript_47106/g.143124  ORF Transcript_47106/g.143124 Transcript_47106/m.143124 type:complete len:205 (-) Transcript_47106:304-918(-)